MDEIKATESGCRGLLADGVRTFVPPISVYSYGVRLEFGV